MTDTKSKEAANTLKEVRPGVFRFVPGKDEWGPWDLLPKVKNLVVQKAFKAGEKAPVVEFEDNNCGPLTIRLDRFSNVDELIAEYFFCTQNNITEMGPMSRPRFVVNHETFWPQEDGTTILEVSLGCTFNRTAKVAKMYAASLMRGNSKASVAPVVRFKFNSVMVKVNYMTNLENLDRDYHNAIKLQIEEIGPDTLEEVPEETRLVLEKYEKEQEKLSQAWQKEADKEHKAKEAEFAKLTEGQKLAIKPGLEDEYAAYVEKNSEDDYSRCVVDFGERWALLLQAKIEAGAALVDVAEETSRMADSEGITGFMYGCAVQALSYFWVHGDALKVWHNAQYGVTDEGVVNPAVLTIK